MNYAIRAAVDNDADGIVDILQRSVKELCAHDHNDKKELIDIWLDNKDSGTVRRWIGHPSALILVAVDKKNGNILGVGGLLESGEITLNYVSPDYRNQGVSATLLKSMEDYLSGLGVMAVRLNSTLTARSFYKSRGYVENGRAETGDGLTSFPMLKKLQAC